MYKIGENVLYGSEGICKITDIVTRTINNQEKDFYLLTSSSNKINILVPLNSELSLAKMRKILSENEIYKLIEAMPDNETIWIKDKNVRKKKYTEIIVKGNHKQLVKLIKTLYLNKQEQIKKGKKFHAQDMYLLEMAEKMLYEEFSYTLNIKPEEVLPFIIKNIKVKEKGKNNV